MQCKTKDHLVLNQKHFCFKAFRVTQQKSKVLNQILEAKLGQHATYNSPSRVEEYEEDQNNAEVHRVNPLSFQHSHCNVRLSSLCSLQHSATMVAFITANLNLTSIMHPPSFFLSQTFSLHLKKKIKVIPIQLHKYHER